MAMVRRRDHSINTETGKPLSCNGLLNPTSIGTLPIGRTYRVPNTRARCLESL